MKFLSLLCLVALPALSGCDPLSHGPREAPEAPDKPPRTLTFAAFAAAREAGAALLPAFAARWEAETGERLKFEESYQASGTQARAVKEGFEADIVLLSLEPDVEVIEEAGLITHDWRAGAAGGIASSSVVVIAVRPGNPKGIKAWTDLKRADVEVLTPNVRTSGGAMWNALAIWGAGMRGHAGAAAGDVAGSLDLLRGVLSRVSVMDKSGRDSIMTFEKGIGDAAITYEHEVITAQRSGKPMDYVVPSSTIRIENPIALVDSYADRHGNRAAAEALIQFTLSAEGQALLRATGLRGGQQGQAEAGPQPADLFTVRDLGGWAAVRAGVFGPGGVWDQALPTAPAVQGGR